MDARQREFENALSASEARLRAFLDNSPSMIFLKDLAGRYTYVNRWFCEAFHLVAERTIGRTDAELFPVETARLYRGNDEEVIAARRAIVFEETARHDDGVHVSIATKFPLFDARGEIVATGGIITDISERKRAEQTLLESERRSNEHRAVLQTILDSATDFIFMKNRDGRYLVMNEAGARSLGKPASAIVGTDDFAHFSPLDAAAIRERDLRVMESGAAETFEEGYPVSGLTRHLLTIKSACRDVSGHVIGLVGIVRDITERKQAEEALRQLNEELERRVAERTASLRESRERMRAVLDTASDAIITIDARGEIIASNPASERMFGYGAGELIGRNVKGLMPSPHRENHDGYIARYLSTGVARIIGTRLEVQGCRRDGSLFPIEVSVSEVADHRSFTGILRDVTRRKALERQVVEIAVEEEQRVARELHDSIGQELTGLGLMAGALARRLEFGLEEERRLSQQLANGLDRVRQQVRQLCHTLLATGLDAEGLRAALEDLAQRTTEQSEVDCRCAIGSPVPAPDPVTAKHLYRIAQEAVTNALKHGRATRIHIEFFADDDGLRLSIHDNGAGMPRTMSTSGVGIPTMRYRAGMIGGVLQISPGRDGGAVVTCSIPHRNPCDEHRD